MPRSPSHAKSAAIRTLPSHFRGDRGSLTRGTRGRQNLLVRERREQIVSADFISVDVQAAPVLMDPPALTSEQAVSRKRTWSLGQPNRQDVIAGFVTGLFSIPEGMAYASIAGFNPVLGLYSGMVPTFLGSVFARTVLMATTLTSAIALSSQSVL